MPGVEPVGSSIFSPDAAEATAAPTPPLPDNSFPAAESVSPTPEPAPTPEAAADISGQTTPESPPTGEPTPRPDPLTPAQRAELDAAVKAAIDNYFVPPPEAGVQTPAVSAPESGQTSPSAQPETTPQPIPSAKDPLLDGLQSDGTIGRTNSDSLSTGFR